MEFHSRMRTAVEFHIAGGRPVIDLLKRCLSGRRAPGVPLVADDSMLIRLFPPLLNRLFDIDRLLTTYTGVAHVGRICLVPRYRSLTGIDVGEINIDTGTARRMTHRTLYTSSYKFYVALAHPIIDNDNYTCHVTWSSRKVER